MQSVSSLFLDSFPYRPLEYWVEFPVLYSKSLSVIYFIYSSMYMSIPISQFIPPPLPPGNHVCFLHLWLCFCFENKLICTLFLDSIYKHYLAIFVFLCLPSPSIKISRSTHANGIFFLWLSNIPLYIYICTTSSLSSPLLMDILVASMCWLL